jgi:hypothetical protein
MAVKTLGQTLGDLSLAPTERAAFPFGGDEYIIHRNGEGLARVNVSYMPDYKDLHVNWMGGNQLGVSGVRDVMSKLGALYPEAETISGERGTGARTGTSQEGAFARAPLMSPSLVTRPGSGGFFNEEEYLQKLREGLTLSPYASGSTD